MSREAFEKEFKPLPIYVFSDDNYYLDDECVSQDDIDTFRLYRAKWVGWKAALAQAPVVAELDQLADRVEELYGEDSDELAAVNDEQQTSGDAKNYGISIAKKFIALKESKS